MKISELIRAVGDNNVKFQNLDHCAYSLNYSTKRGTTISFSTDQALTPEGTRDIGLVVWLPRDAVAKATGAGA